MAGPNQKSSAKGPLEALEGSNFARKGAGMEVDDGDAAKVGYTKQAYSSAGPATSQAQIGNTRSSVGSLGNDGTSRNSYMLQPDILNAEDPNVKTGNG